MVELIFIVLNLCFVVYLIYYIVAFLSGAPFVPTVNSTAQSMIAQARLKKGMTAVDLGSGDGKLLFLIAKTGAAAVGIEINPLLYIYTQVRILFSPYRNQVSVLCRDFWTSDISRADAVFVYLLPNRMKRLEEKLKRELKPGALIVSNSFLFPDWKLHRQDPKRHVFVYRVS